MIVTPPPWTLSPPLPTDAPARVDVVSLPFTWTPDISWSVVLSLAALIVSVAVAARTVRGERFDLRIELDGFDVRSNQLRNGWKYLILGLILENRSTLPVAVTKLSFRHGEKVYDTTPERMVLKERNFRNRDDGPVVDHVTLYSTVMPVAISALNAKLALIVYEVPESFGPLPGMSLALLVETTRDSLKIPLDLPPSEAPNEGVYLTKKCPPLKRLEGPPSGHPR